MIDSSVIAGSKILAAMTTIGFPLKSISQFPSPVKMPGIATTVSPAAHESIPAWM